MSNKFRIGIIGGMGPMAGVLLQKLIIEATPAAKDQDHIQVICFTNPQIPDRTKSLEEDDGKKFIREIQSAGNLLVSIGCNLLVIPCHTAHTRLSEIRDGIPVPVLNMVTLGLDYVAKHFGAGTRMGLCATDGTIKEDVYRKAAQEYGLQLVIPADTCQREVMRVIYDIKAGRVSNLNEAAPKITRHLKDNGAEIVILGCTELSLYFDDFLAGGVPIVDPLRITAKYLVEINQRDIVTTGNNYIPFDNRK